MSNEPKPTPHPDQLRGYQKICRSLGGVKIQGVAWVWDYHQETAVKKDQQTKEDRNRSNRAKRMKML